jgi:hypothetical protein
LECSPVIASELTFRHTIDPAGLLFLAKLATIVRYTASPELGVATMFPGWISPTLKCALRGETSLPLEE